MQQIITVIITIAVFVFFVANHFKKQKIDRKIFIPFIIFTLLSVECFIRYQSLHLAVMGLMLRFLVGTVIGILQGLLANITMENQETFTEGTLLGMAFWLVFIPIRVIVLPWIESIAHGSVNLNSSEYMGIAAFYILAGFFLTKPVTLIMRKSMDTAEVKR